MKKPKYPMVIEDGDARVTIRLVRDHGLTAYRLEYYLDGVRKIKTRADESEAQVDAGRIIKMLNNRPPVFAETEDGTVLHNAKSILAGIAPVDIAAREYANAFRRLNGVSLADAVDFFLKHQPANSGKKIAELVDEFLADAGSDMGKETFKQMRRRLRRFKKSFAGNLATVTTLDIKKWIKGLSLGHRARNNERASLVQFFRWARTHDYLPKGLPVAPEEIAKLEVETVVSIFPVDTVTKLLAALKKEKSDLLHYAAIGFFAGVRPAELSRLEWKDVRWNFGDIEVPSAKSKTGTRRLTKLQDNLKVWLAETRDEVGLIAPKDADEKLAAFAKKMGIAWPRDVMRHSFISYLVAKLQQIGQVALWAGNSEAIVKKHYLERVTEVEGEAFFSIMPDGPANVIEMKGGKAKAKAA